jgi:hypothetical protein
MNLKRILLPFSTMMVAFFGTILAVHEPVQDENAFTETLNERDFDALKDFLRSKRLQNVAEGGEDKLVISGDVRTEWRFLTERQNGKPLRGSDAKDLHGVPVSKNDFDIEMNLRFDYVTKRTWVVAHLQYDNGAGVDDNDKSCHEDPAGYHGSGECGDVCLKKAFFGYNVFDDGCSRFDVELGRRQLYNAFDSRIQFLSRFDGLLLTYTGKFSWLKEWYWMIGGFVVDERVNHFGWATEIGLLNILESGVDFKYSLIDWEKFGTNRCNYRNPMGYRFLNSQFLLIYNFEPEIVRTKAKVFGAFLVNHKGHHKYMFDVKTRDYLKTSRHQNTGWYVGFQVGEVLKEGDWSFEIQYQYVQAFAMPDKDVSGIGRGNVRKSSITAEEGRGNTNYKGWRFEGLCALTDDLTVDSILEFSQAVDPSIGGSHHYSKFEIETIYAF